MSHNNYNTKIIEHLLSTRNHVRGLARALNTNQTTIARKLQELYQQNVVDYKQEGKNKVFYVKKTLEAKQYAYLVEINKQQETLHEYPQLRTLFENIRKNSKITLAILFGSYAKGAAHKDSDIDVYLDTKDKGLKEAVELLGSKISVVIGPYNTQSPLIREIEKSHVILKGMEEYYEKTQFFA